MYASKIEIEYEPQKVRYQREVKLEIDLLDGLFTLEDIGKHLKKVKSLDSSNVKKVDLDYLLLT